MINFNRVFAMVLRHTYNMKHNLDRLTDMFYWPAMDLVLWGLAGVYFVGLNKDFSDVLLVVVSGLVFWVVVWRAQYEINTNLLMEFWDRNLVSLFASPLKVSEWMLSFIIFGFLKTIVSIAFSALLAYWLYQYNVFTFGPMLIPFFISLIITGWAFGFIVAAFLIRFGSTIQTLAWAGVAFIGPFSGLFYPTSILPGWAQKVASFLPSSYIFEGIREILFTGQISYDKLTISFLLNFIYLVLAVWFFIAMFNKSKALGFGRLT